MLVDGAVTENPAQGVALLMNWGAADLAEKPHLSLRALHPATDFGHEVTFEGWEVRQHANPLVSAYPIGSVSRRTKLP